jgi:hypothetical protein
MVVYRYSKSPTAQYSHFSSRKHYSKATVCPFTCATTDIYFQMLAFDISPFLYGHVKAVPYIGIITIFQADQIYWHLFDIGTIRRLAI